jgi:hypothetical protein
MALLGQRQMSHGIDPAVHSMKPPSHRACPDRVFTNADATQLANRDDAVLLLRNGGEPQVSLGDFPVHIPG